MKIKRNDRQCGIMLSMLYKSRKNIVLGPKLQCLLKVKGDSNPNDKYVLSEGAL